MDTTVQLGTINGVAPNSLAMIPLPLGRTIKAIELVRGGTAFNHAHIEYFDLLADGKSLGQITGAHLDKKNQFDGLAAANDVTGISAIRFDRPGLLNPMEIVRTAIGSGRLSEIDSLALGVKIGGATAPQLTGRVIEAGPAPLGDVLKYRTREEQVGGAGTKTISDIARGDVINRIFIFKDSGAGNITNVELIRNHTTIFDRTPDLNNHIQADGVKVPQADLFVIDPTELGVGDEPIFTGGFTDFRLKITTDGAADFTIGTEYMGGLNGN